MEDKFVIDYDAKLNKFIITCPYFANELVRDMPDRKYNKRRGYWVAPVLTRNIKYIIDELPDDAVTPEAAVIIEGFFEELKAQKARQTETFPAWYKFKTEPMKHQRADLDAMWGMSEYALLWEQGVGKTKQYIDFACALRMAGLIDGVIVTCPTSVKNVWPDELAVHAPIPYQTHVATAGKWKAVDTFVATDNEFPWLIFGLESFSQGNASQHALRAVKSGRFLVVVDESTAIKNASSKRTEIVHKLGESAEVRGIMTGTPVTQGLEDFYSQFYFLDPNILGFQSFYTFRNHFCIMGGFEDREIVGYANSEELMGLIAGYCSRRLKKDALDLPDKIYMPPRKIMLSKEQREIYDALKKDMIAEVKMAEETQTIEVKSVIEQMGRLQEVTGGNYSVFNPELKGGRGAYESFPIKGKNAKMEDLLQYMEEVKGQKVIVWAKFRPEIAMIVERLRKAGYETVEFHGGNRDTRHESVAAIQTGTAQVIVASYAMSKGQTLTASTAAYYFSKPFSLEDYLQSQDRNHRKGTVNKVSYDSVVTDGGIDSHVEGILGDKEDVANYVSDKLRSGMKMSQILGDLL